jgi:hypothetical protein
MSLDIETFKVEPVLEQPRKKKRNDKPETDNSSKSDEGDKQS